MCKNIVCNPPDELVCKDISCPLTTTCRYISSCISRLVSNTLHQYSCACNYTENGLEVFKLPECVLPTTSPTLYPTLSPTNSSYMGNGNIKEDVEDKFDEMYYYIMGAVLFVIICVMVKFRQCVRNYFCCKNRVRDDET